MMTSKAAPSTQPAQLSEAAAEKVQGGHADLQELWKSSVKDTRPTSGDTGFIPSAGTSRMD